MCAYREREGVLYGRGGVCVHGEKMCVIWKAWSVCARGEGVCVCMEGVDCGGEDVCIYRRRGVGEGAIHICALLTTKFLTTITKYLGM